MRKVDQNYLEEKIAEGLEILEKDKYSNRKFRRNRFKNKKNIPEKEPIFVVDKHPMEEFCKHFSIQKDFNQYRMKIKEDFKDSVTKADFMMELHLKREGDPLKYNHIKFECLVCGIRWNMTLKD